MTLMLLEISPLAVVHEFILATFIKNEFEYVKNDSDAYERKFIEEYGALLQIL